MSEISEIQRFEINVGALRSEITLQIHSKYVARLWYGRKPSDNVPGIVGFNQFLYITNKIYTGSKQDDPYADLFMLCIEEKIDTTKALLNQINSDIDEILSKIPVALTVSENISVEPVSLPVIANSHLGYLAVYLLAEYDELSRKISLALYIAMLDYATAHIWIERCDHSLRSLLTLVQRYKFLGINRTDIAQKNTAALAAIEKYGQVPQDILDGTKRSRFSPPLRTSISEIEDSAEQEQDTDAKLMLVMPAESEIDKD